MLSAIPSMSWNGSCRIPGDGVKGSYVVKAEKSTFSPKTGQLFDLYFEKQNN
jgi:hypothetical protein